MPIDNNGNPFASRLEFAGDSELLTLLPFYDMDSVHRLQALGGSRR
jgi:hypothetical protein